jgi:hypothetical protein
MQWIVLRPDRRGLACVDSSPPALRRADPSLGHPARLRSPRRRAVAVADVPSAQRAGRNQVAQAPRQRTAPPVSAYDDPTLTGSVGRPESLRVVGPEQHLRCGAGVPWPGKRTLAGRSPSEADAARYDEIAQLDLTQRGRITISDSPTRSATS